MNSKQKGNRGERELAKLLREYGFETRRSQQYAGGTEESADVVGLPYIHIECKRVERLNIDEAMEQAWTDNYNSNGGNTAATGIMPAVFHRKNNKEWLVTMRLRDWIEVYKEYFAGREIEAERYTQELEE
jgi:Holliday junction resolvase